ncbi:hypothetical protein [Streptomyces sp. NPDC053427]|uniref:DUF7848 domain-containing protein n=1 Tax=Streptomyces sp. NPDC053427 TaxID=3365701 RepID=UPI0037D33E07
MTDMALRYVGTCLTCGGQSTDTADADEAQVWCLQHAGTTHHTGYELSAVQYFGATLADPTTGGAATAT